MDSVKSALCTAALALPNRLAVDPRAPDSLDEALFATEWQVPAQAEQLVALARATLDQAFVGVIATLLLLVTALGISVTIWAICVDDDPPAALGRYPRAQLARLELESMRRELRALVQVLSAIAALSDRTTATQGDAGRSAEERPLESETN